MLNIIIFGAPGSGKGTQGEKLAKKYGLEHVSTGDMLRAEIEAGTEFGRLADSYISKGNLIPDEVMISKLNELMEKRNGAKGFILDGFPRTVAQAKALDEMDVKMDGVISLEVEDDVIIHRLGGRRL